jgi:hypothetical protein
MPRPAGALADSPQPSDHLVRLDGVSTDCKEIGEMKNLGRTVRNSRLPLYCVVLSGILFGGVGCTIDGSATAAATPATSTTASGSTETGAGTDTSTSGNNGATPARAVTYWVTQLLEGHYRQVCLASAPAAAPGQDPQQACANPQFTTAATSLRSAWAKPGITLPPKSAVKVTAPARQNGDGTATIPDTSITVDGHTLRSLELIGASGDTSSFSLSFVVQKVGRKWVVSKWNMNL